MWEKSSYNVLGDAICVTILKNDNKQLGIVDSIFTSHGFFYIFDKLSGKMVHNKKTTFFNNILLKIT